MHRLDLETSGVMVFARSRLAQRHLNWQFERRQVRKGYVARVAGRVEGEGGRIDAAAGLRLAEPAEADGVG